MVLSATAVMRLIADEYHLAVSLYAIVSTVRLRGVARNMFRRGTRRFRHQGGTVGSIQGQSPRVGSGAKPP